MKHHNKIPKTQRTTNHSKNWLGRNLPTWKMCLNQSVTANKYWKKLKDYEQIKRALSQRNLHQKERMTSPMARQIPNKTWSMIWWTPRNSTRQAVQKNGKLENITGIQSWNANPLQPRQSPDFVKRCSLVSLSSNLEDALTSGLQHLDNNDKDDSCNDSTNGKMT